MNESIYKQLFRLIKPYWPQLIGSTLAAFLYVAFNSASIWFTASMLNSVLSNFQDLIAEHETLKIATDISLNQQLKLWTNEFIMRDSAMATLKTLSIVIIIVFVLKNVCLYLKNVLLTVIQYKFITVLRDKLYEQFLNLSLSYFNKNKAGELTSIVINDVSNMQRAFTVGFQQAFVEPLNIIVFITLLFIINLKLALIAVIIIPITGLIITAIGRSIRRRSRRIAAQIAEITHKITETLSAMRVVKAFITEKYELNRFQKETSRFYQLIMRRTRLRLTSSPGTEIIGILVAVVLLIVGGRDVLVNQTMTSEDFLRFILVLFSALAPIRLLSNVNMEIQEGLASAERVFKILNTEPDIVNIENAKQINTFNEKIKFENVSFNYTNTEEKIIDNISFTIDKGEVVALVGESGAGKSTIADLVPRFYDVIEGSITLDGTDIRKINVRSLRKLMGIVTQETILFNDTIEANIAYGVPEAPEESVRAAAKTANALDFIQEQPQGFDTVIGDMGVKLSGGQRQRLAIARAVLNNPPILILDEATSSLDTHSEKLVQEALEKLMQKRTVLVIAHRLSTIQNASKIIVLEKGKVVEIDSHDELLRKCELYKRLYHAQYRSTNN